jgi:molybdopterin converting factor small subunit
MADVKVIATGALNKRLHEGATVAAGQTVRQATEDLKLDIAGGLALIPLVNGRAVEWHHILKPGDELHLVPIVAGG